MKSIYIGFSRPYNLSLMENSVLDSMESIPGLLKVLDKHPELKKLFVSIEKYPVKKQEMSKPGTVLYKINKKIINDTINLRRAG